MNVVESYLEKGWGDSLDNPKVEDLKTAIEETKKMDDEHGAFWVAVFGDDDNEIVLEVSKNLQLTLILDPENLNPETFNEKSANAESWEEIINIFKLLLTGDVNQIQKWINKKK